MNGECSGTLLTMLAPIGTLPRHAERLFHLHTFIRLINVWIWMPVASNEELEPFLRTLAQASPALESLTLYLVGVATLMSFESFFPLHQYSLMQSFFVHCNQPILIEPSHVETMASSWPGIKTLDFKIYPTTTQVGSSSTPITILHAFARHIRHPMGDLSMHLTIPDDLSQGSSLLLSSPLRVAVLDVGRSMISSGGQMTRVMALLGYICTPGVRIEWSTEEDPSTEGPEEAERVSRWKAVADGVQALHALQGDLRQRLEEKDEIIRSLEEVIAGKTVARMTL